MSYESIAQYTGSSSTGTFDIINFNSIPSTYKHLMVIGKIACYYSTPTAATTYIRFNSDSTANTYKWYLQGQRDSSGSVDVGSNDLSYIGAITPARLGSSGDVEYGTFYMFIPNYASTTTKKNFWVWSNSVLAIGSEHPSAESRLWTVGGYWNNTSAINNLNFTSDTNPDFASLTNLSIYGLKE